MTCTFECRGQSSQLPGHEQEGGPLVCQRLGRDPGVVQGSQLDPGGASVTGLQTCHSVAKWAEALGAAFGASLLIDTPQIPLPSSLDTESASEGVGGIQQI